MSDFERDVTAPVTFADFNPKFDAIYNIGDDVIPQMAEVFGHELTYGPDVDNLGELIGDIGPAKTLQDNIELANQRLGTDDDAVDLARNWVERSGLLLPVERSFLDTEKDVPNGSDFYIITGGIANWMHRRADTLITEIDCVGVQIGKVILAGSNREMKQGERDDLLDGEKEHMYMRKSIVPKLEEAGISVDDCVAVDSQSGYDVANMVARQIPEDVESVTVVSNAGGWVQNAGQIGRAMISNGIDPAKLYVISDEFPLGTGKEPASTHQNPFSALGQIARNAQEFARWQS